jgi:hypothetical protein
MSTRAKAWHAPNEEALPLTAETGIPKAERDPAWFTLSVVCLVMGIATFLLSATVADPDLWGHVKFGQDIWRSGQIIQRDTYSYLTGDQPWINHEWLAEVIFAAVFALGGSKALMLFKTGLALLTVGLVYWHLGRRGVSALPGGLVLVVMSLLLTLGIRVLRPQIFTFLLFVITLVWLDAADRGRLRWLWGIPLIFALWINFHGGFLAGMGIVVVWSVTRIVVSFCRAPRHGWGIRGADTAFVASAVAAGCATLLNPYGAGLLQFLVQPATIVRPDITEWQPVAIMSGYGIIYLIFLAMAMCGLLYSTRERRPGPLVVFICLAILPLLAVRHGSLFALGIPIMAGEHIGAAWDRLSSKVRSCHGRKRQPRTHAWFAGIAIAGAAMCVWLSLPNFGCMSVQRITLGGYPARAVAVLRESGVSGNLATFFVWGEYAIWYLSPQLKVSFDGRRETVYSEKAQEENWRFVEGRKDWDTLIAAHETHLALVPKTYPVFNLLKLSPRWVLVYEDSFGSIFAREGSPLVPRIRAVNPPPLPDDGVGMCFP